MRPRYTGEPRRVNPPPKPPNAGVSVAPPRRESSTLERLLRAFAARRRP